MKLWNIIITNTSCLTTIYLFVSKALVIFKPELLSIVIRICNNRCRNINEAKEI